MEFTQNDNERLYLRKINYDDIPDNTLCHVQRFSTGFDMPIMSYITGCHYTYVREIMTTFVSNSNIKSLKLVIQNCVVTHELIDIIFENISDYKPLTELEFINVEFKNESDICLINAINNNHNIRKLEIYSSDMNNYHLLSSIQEIIISGIDKNIDSFLLFLRSTTTLRKITLNTEDVISNSEFVEFNPDIIVSIIKVMRDNCTVESININCKIDEPVVKQFMELINENKTITSLDIGDKFKYRR